jgi:TDG/mug DNA glycosylase family protein
MRPDDVQMLLDLGVGITNIVPTASARADQLTAVELRDGGKALEATVRRLHPKVVAVLGLTAYRQAFGRPKAPAGKQDDTLGGAELWVLPNPSGLNAHETVKSLAAAYREAWLSRGP